MIKSILDLSAEQLLGKTVLMRCDLNVPVKDGKILDLTRVHAIKSSLNYLLDKGATVVLASHFGRPKSSFDDALSFKNIVEELEEALSEKIRFIEGYQVKNFEEAKLYLLENLRFDSREEKNEDSFAKELSKGVDFYVNEAFSCSHRAHASIEAITKFLPSYAGLNLLREVEQISKIIASNSGKVVAIVGGGKVSSKIHLLENLLNRTDYVVIVGAMANNFLKVLGVEVGDSLIENEYLDYCEQLLKKHNDKIVLPSDFVVSQAEVIKVVSAVPMNGQIFDIGPETCVRIYNLLATCRGVIWNGPAGMYENEYYRTGTLDIARAIAKFSASDSLTSIAGGGDVVAAIEMAGVASSFSHISTAGGAFLEFLEGRSLPGLIALEKVHLQ